MSIVGQLPNATEDARARLAAECEALQRNQHLFSFETLRGWHELQRRLETSLNDIVRGVEDAGEQAADIAVSRLEELTRAVHALREHNEDVHARQVMSHGAVCCHPQDSLTRAAQSMWERDCGVLPVIDGDRKLVGILTDRDICMAAFTQGRALHEIQVVSVMATQLQTCAVSDTLTEIAAKLREHQLHRMPVVDTANQVVGMVSLVDIARHLSTLHAGHPLRALLVPTLAGIGEPRVRSE